MHFEKLTDYERDLASKNYRLVFFIAKEYKYPEFPIYEDYCSLGAIGLLKACKSFDPSKGFQFSTYASRFIRNEIIMYFRENEKYDNFFSLDMSYSDTDICYDTYTDSEDFTNTLATNDLFANSLNIILNNLNKTERFIILCRMSDLYQEDISRLLGCTQGYVSRLERRSYPKIKQMLEEPVATYEIYMFDITSSLYTLSIDLDYINLHFNDIVNTINDLAIKFLMYEPKVHCKENMLVLYLLPDNNCFIFIAFLINELSTNDNLKINSMPN